MIKKIFSKVSFINTSLSRDKIRILKSDPGLNELNDASNDVFKSGIIERYRQRIFNGCNDTVKDICL